MTFTRSFSQLKTLMDSPRTISDDPEEVRTLAAEFWNCHLSDQIQTEKVCGGITNILYHVWLADDSVAPVQYPNILVRIFGRAGSMVIDRQCEASVVELLDRHEFGPKMLGKFENGRIEEFFPSRRPLDSVEMMNPMVSEMIARRLRELHNIPITDTCDSSAACIFPNLACWLKLARETSRPPPIPLDQLAEEIEWAKENVVRLAAGSTSPLCSIVLCHNDLLGGNILINEKFDDIVFIDFEYASLNYAGFDIANHFCALPESALISTGKYDMHAFPSLENQHHFLNVYLDGKRTKLAVHEQSAETLASARDQADSDSDDLRILAGFCLLAELRWIVWSIVQAEHSTVKFDYENYARERFGFGYLKFKKRFQADDQA